MLLPFKISRNFSFLANKILFYVALAFLLAFPIIFLLGLLPQIDTFTMHVLEQFHIHIFGGSGKYLSRVFDRQLSLEV